MPVPQGQPVAKTKQETLDWLQSISGDLATITLQKLDELLPWYRTMPAARRSTIGLVAQAGITSFVAWYKDPKSQPWVAADVFGTAPRELLRSISLQETLQLIRVVVQVVEDRVVQEDESLREAVLLYSREIAFSAADVYARAAEARGLWDARLEALVVDSILSGEHEEELPSRIAALGWRARGAVAAVIGTAAEPIDQDGLRRVARKHSVDALIGVHGNRLIVVLGRIDESKTESQPSFQKIATALDPFFGAGGVVIGPEVGSVAQAHRSAKAALAGFAAIKSWPKPPRHIAADDLLAERALGGDMLAKSTLLDIIYRPLASNSPELLETLAHYLETGRSLESTARELFVHPNTVRYRLKRISEIIGWDATGPREAFVLQVAMVLGSMSEIEARKRR
ncbi:PucR family transcriptional regulator [Rhodoluna limnophila]|uniref:PucR family transcriptional regulator n=1 Tax=Rhodoluna limnophila TaxID=232537 RepID=UPI0011065667|nr:helix-turn-helix domain-containing protein [Rhodoluna limnophila]